MLKKILLSLAVICIQFLPIQEAQAVTGYTSWNEYVRGKLNCNSDTRQCSTFTEGKKIYSAGYSICTWSGNDCVSSKAYTVYGNDPYAILATVNSHMNPMYERRSNYQITIANVTTQMSSNEDYLYFTIYANYPGGYYGTYGNGSVSKSDMALCTGFISGIGCPNQPEHETPLDRTKIKDGPCDICSKWGNPFDVRNGSKTETTTDLIFPLSLSRLYSSKMKSAGMFGVGWKSNYDKKLEIIKKSGIIKALVFTTPDDENIIYTTNSSGVLVPAYADSSQYQIKIENGSIILLRPDSGLEYYDETSGRITHEVYKGNYLNYQYNTMGMLYRVSNNFGAYLQFHFSGYADVISQITVSNGDILTYTYSDGNVSTFALNGVNQVGYEYSGILLTGKKNASNIKYASFAYDNKNRGIENKWITNDGHDVKKYTFTYGTNQTSVTQGNGFSRVYSLSKVKDQTKIQGLNWNGFTEQSSFNYDGYVTTRKDFNNTYDLYTYDTAGRVLTSSRDGKNITLTWDTVNNVLNTISENSANGTRVTTYTYDTDFNVLQKTVTGLGGPMTWSYTWLSEGRIGTETTPDGVVTTYSYKPVDTTTSSGLPHSIATNSGKSLVINSYDSRGNPISVTANGVNKEMTYNDKGQVLSESTQGITNNYTYDLEGNLTNVQMASGYQLNMTYDTANRMLSIQDNMGGSTAFTIDDYTGEDLNTSILQNNTLVMARNKVLDSLGRTKEQWNATTKTKRLTTYSSYIDKPNSTTDANSIATTYSWNKRDQVTNYSGGGIYTSQTYDIDKNKRSVSTSNQLTSMNYDDFGRITQLTSPDSGSHTYAYNTANRTVVHTDAKGITHTSSSDLNGNPITIAHTSSGNTENESYTYDTNGELTGFVDSSGSTAYVKNAFGQVTSKTQNIGTKSFTVQYSYNAIGQKISETYPSGLIVAYTYDNGFLNSIGVDGANIVSSISYNSMLNEPVSWVLGGNAVAVNKDTDGLLTSFTESGIFNQSVTTDNEGNVKNLTDNVSSNNFSINLSTSYAMSTANINTKSLTYSLAENNNLYSQQDGLVKYTFNTPYSSNKTTNFYDEKYKYFNYQYDANGNTTADNKGTYIYDFKNNMISSSRTYTENSLPVTKIGNYMFNALGHRVGKIVDGQTSYFIYNENNQLIGEYDENGSLVSEYVYFGLRPVAVKTSGNIHVVHTDYLATPRVITSGSGSGGNVVWQWMNDNPYGYNKAQGTIEFNLRFSGQYYDSESELHYNIHRTYNPEVGRYMQSDPIGLAGGLNTYNYVNRNPLNAVDPMGLDLVVFKGSGWPGHIGLGISGYDGNIWHNLPDSGIVKGGLMTPNADMFINTAPEYSLSFMRVKTTKAQDDKLKEYFKQSLIKNLKYHWIFNNCVDFVKQALDYADIKYGSYQASYMTISPKTLPYQIGKQNEILEIGTIGFQEMRNESSKNNNYYDDILAHILRPNL